MSLLHYDRTKIGMVLGCLGACIFSFTYFAYNQEWILFRLPLRQKKIIEQAVTCITKRKVQRWYWNNDAWHKEETELLWSDNQADALSYLIASWLSLLDEEKIMEKKVSLQSVIVSPSQVEAYISFDRNPFMKSDSTYEKLMWMEGLLKTLRENDIKIQNIHFLVHHQPLHDFHLDFSNSWPLSGFLAGNEC